ncbi:MAG: hypothetical protein H6744_11540 [Deltaproteobacteria bacterium]|nr:hypothetical protein [Deltaproteobacteria bacterium]
MTRRPLPARRAGRGVSPGLALLAALALSACGGKSNGPTGAFESPIDFSYACEGTGDAAGHTTAPLAPNERTRSLADAFVCSADQSTGYDARLYGLVLNAKPAGVHFIQLNPTARGGREVLDANPVIPGFSPVPVADGPVRLLRSSDYEAFWVLSAAEPAVTPIVVQGYDEALRSVRVALSPERWSLPGAPSDGLILPGTDPHLDTLLVTAARVPEMWTMPVSRTMTDAPPITTIPLPGRVASIEALGDDLLVTWVGRPVISRIARDGTVIAEAGIRPECSDTLDNDGDGLTDADDPDCYGETDITESGGVAARPDDASGAALSSGAVPFCADGLDNDGDGLTDDEDPACDGDDAGEARPQCADGLDNDGDGLTDTDDESCYGSADLHESQLGPFGPYGAALVDAGDIGRFVYVTDPQRVRVAVFQVTDAGFVRVVATAPQGEVERTSFADYDELPYGDASVKVDRVITHFGSHAAGLPAPEEAGEQDIVLPAPVADKPTAGHLRGEWWERIVDAPDGLSLGQSRSQVWLPQVCDSEIDCSTAFEDICADDPAALERCDVVTAPGPGQGCTRPPTDDQSWFVFLPRLDGTLQLIESIRAGMPLHQLAQASNEPRRRTMDVTRPALSIRGERLAFGSRVPDGYPFLGPFVEEKYPQTDRELEVAPQLFRRYGITPPGVTAPADACDTWIASVDLEQIPTEGWTVTYEGVIPGTDQALGRFEDGATTATEATFFDPKARFAELGVEVGDWLTLELSPAALDDARREALAAAGLVPKPTGKVRDTVMECPTYDPDVALLEFPIVAIVDDATLTLDLGAGRLRPVAPVLDEPAIKDSELALADCRSSRETLRDTLTIPEDEKLRPVAEVWPGFVPGELPDRLLYSVRGHGQWIVVGDRSGFRPDRGRVATAQVERTVTIGGTQQTSSAYAACPPALDEIGLDAYESTLAGTEPHLNTTSFGLDVFPGCRTVLDNDLPVVEMVPAQRDTQWTFTVAGPQVPRTISGGSIGVRAPFFDLWRWLVELDPVNGRVRLIEVRAGDGQTLVQGIFE